MSQDSRLRSEVGRVVPNEPVGRPLARPTRKQLDHSIPAWADRGAIYFITICCAERGKNSLARPEVFHVLASATEHYVSGHRWWMHLLLAMPDHLHALVSFDLENHISVTIRDWKRWTAREAGITWQSGFFDHRLRSDESFEEKEQYIRLNPARAGLCAEESWRFCWTPHAESAR